jgi:uncharacterized protein (DUF4415 family)
MRKLTPKQKAEIDALVRLPDDRIDTSDVPEVNFSDKAVVGKFYRPVKKAISVRLDADVLAWLKKSGPATRADLTRSCDVR